MDISSEKNARRILAVGVLFATVGILALVITLMQPTIQNDRERLANEIFQPSNEEKREVLAELQAVNASGADISTEEKLRVLQQLQMQE